MHVNGEKERTALFFLNYFLIDSLGIAGHSHSSELYTDCVYRPVKEQQYCASFIFFTISKIMEKKNLT